jgi:hypothetical protein
MGGRMVGAGDEHRWAPMTKKNFVWIDTNNQLTTKNIDMIGGRQKKNLKLIEQYYRSKIKFF